MTLTSQGEQLVGYARRLLAVNDETWSRMTAPAFVGEINLGCPDDLLSPRVPSVMRAFAGSHPHVKVHLHSAQTVFLKERFTRGELDVILTTEADLDPGGETLASEPLVWTGAPGGAAWRQRPLPFGTVAGCIFNKAAIETLNAAGFDWKLEVNSVSNPVMDASIAADIVVRLHMRQHGAGPVRGDPAPRRPAAVAGFLRQHVCHAGAATTGWPSRWRSACAPPTPRPTSSPRNSARNPPARTSPRRHAGRPFALPTQAPRPAPAMSFVNESHFNYSLDRSFHLRH